MERPEISIIGLGVLGSALCRAAVQNGISVKSIFNRTGRRALELGNRHDIDIAAAFPVDDAQLGNLIFITVSDGAIAGTADRLAALSVDLTGKTVVHCSGSEPAALLSKLKDQGAHTASVHPLQTFNRNSGPEDFREAYFSLQGDRKAMPLLRKIIHLLGGEAVEVTAAQKAHLHAAAVMACNYLVTLLDNAVNTATISGLEDKQVRQLLFPLIQTTVKNSADLPFEKALSGPVARGDRGTLEKHLELLKNNPDLRTFYCRLGLETVEKAKNTGVVDGASADEMRRLFEKQL